MPKKIAAERNMEFYRAILLLKDEEECRRFFDDICSAAELSSMEQRYQVAALLTEGKVYTDILERTGASSATISRVNRMLQGGTGAVAEILERSKTSTR